MIFPFTAHGGAIEGIQLPLHSAFKSMRHSPFEMRNLFKKLGWRRIVGFQTRNPLHRAQYELTLRAMAQVKANLYCTRLLGMSIPATWTTLPESIAIWLRGKTIRPT